jgi:hypothetical protein
MIGSRKTHTPPPSRHSAGTASRPLRQLRTARPTATITVGTISATMTRCSTTGMTASYGGVGRALMNYRDGGT